MNISSINFTSDVFVILFRRRISVLVDKNDNCDGKISLMSKNKMNKFKLFILSST